MQDFEGIQKFKSIILFFIITMILVNFIGPIYFY